MIPIFIPESLECGANIRSEAHLYGSLIHKLINAHIWVGGDNPSRQPSTSKNTQISIFYPSGTSEQNIDILLFISSSYPLVHLETLSGFMSLVSTLRGTHFRSIIIYALHSH